jgi:hypothetical protein
MSENTLPGGDGGAEPTVLVSGQSRALLERVPLQLFAERVADGDGVVVVGGETDPSVTAGRLRAAAGVGAARVALVDATTKAAGSLSRVDDLRWQVPSPVAFGHVRSALDVAVGALTERGADRVHLLFDALTAQFRLADADIVYQHANDVAMAAGGGPGLGVFTLRPSTAGEAAFERVRHLVDVHVAVRRTERGPEVRWTGLLRDSEGWVPLGGPASDPEGGRGASQ